MSYWRRYLRTDWFVDAVVVRGRRGTLGALVRGWRIESPRLAHHPAANEAVGRLLCDLVDEFAGATIVGIERAGVSVALSIASSGRGLFPNVVSYRAGRAIPRRIPAWSPAEPERGHQVVIVDDVMNSGRTARRAIREVERTGADVVAVVCLVRYPRHRPFLLRHWKGPLLSLFDLEALALRRFGWA